MPHAVSTLEDLAADLSLRCDAQLRALFTLRPDAIDPPVASFAALAARLCSPASIALALDQLTVPQLQVLTALHQIPGQALRNWPLQPGESAHFTATAHLLHRLALLSYTKPKQLDSVSPHGKHHTEPHQLLPLAAVGLALGETPSSARDGKFPTISFSPPHAELAPLRVAMVNNAAASAIEAILRSMTDLLETIHATALPALRDGAASVRSLRRLSTLLAIEEAQLCFLLELAAMAHLIAFVPLARRWEAVSSPWPQLTRPDQWRVLIQAWQGSDRLPFQPRTAPNPGVGEFKPLVFTASKPQYRILRGNTLSAVYEVTSAPAPRLSTGAGTATGTSAGNIFGDDILHAPTSDSITRILRWRHPRLTEISEAQIPGILAEMELLGLTGANALSRPGQYVAARNWSALVDVLAAVLPAPLEHFVLQGDLTAIAPGYLEPTVAATLKTLAAPEGQGTAGTFRFSEASLQNAAATGWTAEGIFGFLRKHASTAVPQSLEYLVYEATRNPTGSMALWPVPAPSTAKPATAKPATAMSELSLRQQSPQASQQSLPADGVVLAELQDQLEVLRKNTSESGVENGEFAVALVLERLRQAIAASAQIQLFAVNHAGDIESFLLQPESFTEGLLRARLIGTGQLRRFSVHSIVGVQAPAHDIGGTP